LSRALSLVAEAPLKTVGEHLRPLTVGLSDPLAAVDQEIIEGSEASKNAPSEPEHRTSDSVAGNDSGHRTPQQHRLLVLFAAGFVAWNYYQHNFGLPIIKTIEMDGVPG
jgi:hypothetical protein